MPSRFIRLILPAAVLWGMLFTFFAAGFWCRDAAFDSGILARAATVHHRIARFGSLPFSRAERGYDTKSLRRTVFISGWGATLWVMAGGMCLVIWSRAGATKKKGDDPRSSANAGNEGGRLSRRALLKGGLATVPLLGGGVGLHAIVVAPGRLRFAEYEIPIRDLPAGLDGMTIAHLSDFHLGDYIGLDHVRRSIAMANEIQPDIALLTGDYVQGSHKGFEPMARVLADELKPRHGYVATLGNHDHWHGAQLARETFAAHFIPLIDNDRRFFSRRDGLTADPRPGSICIGGVGDYWEDDVDFIRATEGASSDMPRIILSHNPDVGEMFAGMKEAAKVRSGAPTRLDLMLSGHTHGGQVRVPFMGTPVLPSRYGQKYSGGLVDGPDWPVLVSRGIGMAVLPVRFGVPPEVVVVTLRRV